jgi:hypothetical protein
MKADPERRIAVLEAKAKSPMIATWVYFILWLDGENERSLKNNLASYTRWLIFSIHLNYFQYFLNMTQIIQQMIQML